MVFGHSHLPSTRRRTAFRSSIQAARPNGGGRLAPDGTAHLRESRAGFRARLALAGGRWLGVANRPPEKRRGFSSQLRGNNWRTIQKEATEKGRVRSGGMHDEQVAERSDDKTDFHTSVR